MKQQDCLLQGFENLTYNITIKGNGLAISVEWGIGKFIQIDKVLSQGNDKFCFMWSQRGRQKEKYYLNLKKEFLLVKGVCSQVSIAGLEEQREIKLPTDQLDLMTFIVPLNIKIPVNSTSFRDLKKQRNLLDCFSNFENKTLTKCRYWI